MGDERTTPKRRAGTWARSIALLVLVFGVVGCASTPPSGDARRAVTQAEIDAAIADASTRFDVPQAWIRSVMQVESGGRTHLNGRPITSHAGAMGLMQVMPGTYAELRRRYDLGPDPFDPHDNVMAGTAYIREMYDQFGSPGFLAAYNAGPGRYRQHLEQGRPLPAETRRYMNMITPMIAGIYPAGEHRGANDLIAQPAPAQPSTRVIYSFNRPATVPTVTVPAVSAPATVSAPAAGGSRIGAPLRLPGPS